MAPGCGPGNFLVRPAALWCESTTETTFTGLGEFGEIRAQHLRLERN